MKHELNYKTKFGGLVCTCTRYFDNEEQLSKHFAEVLMKDAAKKVARI